VERFEMIADSGGAGRWRGGLGFARDYRILADEVRFSLRTDKHAVEPFGSDQGLAGGKGACIVNPGAADETRLPSRFGDYRLKRNDLLRIERPGGGGLGDPLERPVERVLDDVRQGYVTAARARDDYGVAVRCKNGEPEIDPAESLFFRGKK
jgi:N-methylhydantoinase B